IGRCSDGQPLLLTEVSSLYHALQKISRPLLPRDAKAKPPTKIRLTMPAFDAAGNMTTIPKPDTLTASYAGKFDAWNRLVSLDSGTAASYEYDGLNRRIKRVESSATTHFYYNEAWQCVEERSTESGTATKQFLWGAKYVDELVLRDRDADANSVNGLEERFYVLRDKQRCVTALANESGIVQERFAYAAYGESAVLNSDLTSKSGGTSYDWEHRYTARRLDSTTELQLNRNRYYHPQLGRWCTRDPVGYEGSPFHLYQYVASSPLIATDPYGLYDWIDQDGMRDKCKKVRKTQAAKPTPGTISEVDRKNCQTRFSEILEKKPFLKKIWDSLRGDCDVAPVICKNCNLVAYAGNSQLTICWDSFTAYCEKGIKNEADWNIIYHEMIHLQQECEKRLQGRGCLPSLKREVEAYFCANICDEGFESRPVYGGNKCMARAISSSCVSSCNPFADPPEPTNEDFAKLSRWFRKWYDDNDGNRDQMCKNPPSK
ncbi:MAG: RHS repeat-associated core domain-containing protein, partial [Planctomycetota bacterium]